MATSRVRVMHVHRFTVHKSRGVIPIAGSPWRQFAEDTGLRDSPWLRVGLGANPAEKKRGIFRSAVGVDVNGVDTAVMMNEDAGLKTCRGFLAHEI